MRAADVAGYLLDRRLIDPRAVVEGGLRIVDSSRLNRVFIVTAAGERCLVLKAGPGVTREAAVLERLRAAGGLTTCMPVVVAHDPAEDVLVIESARGARDLNGHHAGGRFSCALAREVGRALALVHAVPPAALDGLARAPHGSWGTQVHRPDLETLHTLSAAAVALTRIIQGSRELCAELDELLENQAEATVLHGDLRWDNCLAVRGATRRWTGLQLIDWELSRVGDPAYDIGAFLGEYLRAWLQSIPIADPRDAGRLLAHARLPLERMRPALRAFWAAYARYGRATPAELCATLRRSARYAAVRLLMAALEEAQGLSELRSGVLQLLPLSENILRRPGEAAQLLGLGAAEAAG